MNAKLREKWSTDLMILLLTVCFIPAAAGAATPGDGRQGKGLYKKGPHRSALGIWRDVQMIQTLELSTEQVKQVREADFAFRAKHLELKAQLDGLRLNMDQAFSEDVVDDAAVLALAEKIADIKGKLFVQDIESRLALGKILNSDQIDKLKLNAMHRRNKGPKSDKKSISKRHSGERHDDKTRSDVLN